MATNRQAYVQEPPTGASGAAGPPQPRSSPIRILVLAVALAIVIFNRRIAPSIHYDWLNILPLLATLYICYAVIAFEKIFGISDGARRKGIVSFLLSPYLRSLLLIPLLLLTVEFGLRCASYHRDLLYERQGNLLFTPVPNQEYMEKVSLTRSEIDQFGLRGGAADLSAGKEVVLALGDSITYGYGVDDAHTYPALLQDQLNAKYPGRYTVLNGGVDAYPVSFEHEKFLYLWNRGVHPKVVLIGYSFNEGGLGHLVFSDAKTKDKFASRVRLKNEVRSIALYDLVVENWARHDYDKMKKYMVPGTNFKTMSQDDVDVLYAKQLSDFVSDLRSRGVIPVFVLFCGYDGRISNYDDSGPFQKRFAEFAEKNGIALLRTKTALRQGMAQNADLRPFFQDQAHMKPSGTEKVAEMLAGFIPGYIQQQSTNTVQTSAH
jgi:lysophospholipase L1-like esterase